MRHGLILTGLLLTLLVGCAGVPKQSQGDKASLAIFGASGRIGSSITAEAIAEGYDVVGVSRNPTALQARFPGLLAVQGDLLDRKRTAEIIEMADVVVVSVGGSPTSPDPEQYIVNRATDTLIEVLSEREHADRRFILVGNLFTLESEPGVTMLDAGRADPSHPNFPMFVAHQLALDKLLATVDINWTVVSPPNGFRLKGRTGRLLYGGDELLRAEDGTPLSISREDFAVAVIKEVEEKQYPRQRFTVAREPGY